MKPSPIVSAVGIVGIITLAGLVLAIWAMVKVTQLQRDAIMSASGKVMDGATVGRKLAPYIEPYIKQLGTVSADTLTVTSNLTSSGTTLIPDSGTLNVSGGTEFDGAVTFEGDVSMEGELSTANILNANGGIKVSNLLSAASSTDVDFGESNVRMWGMIGPESSDKTGTNIGPVRVTSGLTVKEGAPFFDGNMIVRGKTTDLAAGTPWWGQTGFNYSPFKASPK